MENSPKRGRPPKPEGEAMSVLVLLRLTPELRQKLTHLGGVQWIRERIRRAKEPPASG